MPVSVFIAPLVMALVAVGAARPAPPQTPQALVGTWGGNRIRVDVTATDARIQVDCLLASTDEAIALDKAGRFAVAVAFVPLGGAPIDGPEDRPASRVTGRVEKDVLHLTIAPEGSAAAGTFTLQRNGKAKLPNCRFRS